MSNHDLKKDIEIKNYFIEGDLIMSTGANYTNTNSTIASQGNSGSNQVVHQNIGEKGTVSFDDPKVMELIEEIKKELIETEGIPDIEMVKTTVAGLEKEVKENNSDGFTNKLEILKLVAPTVTAVTTLVNLFI